MANRNRSAALRIENHATASSSSQEMPAAVDPVDISLPGLRFRHIFLPLALTFLFAWASLELFYFAYTGSMLDMLLLIPHILSAFVGGIAGFLTGFWVNKVIWPRDYRDNE